MRAPVKVAALLAPLLLLTACDMQPSTNAVENGQADAGIRKVLGNQPAHSYDFSQYRQSLQDIEDAQAAVTQTTTFFFNVGVQDPYKVCPSVGYPIASTTEITNPQKAVDGPGTGNVTVGQMDPTGVYPGNSTGTYVLCIGGHGKLAASYVEGYAHTETGPAVWDYTHHTIVDTGDPTFNFKKVTGDTSPKVAKSPSN